MRGIILVGDSGARLRRTILTCARSHSLTGLPGSTPARSTNSRRRRTNVGRIEHRQGLKKSGHDCNLFSLLTSDDQ